MTALISSQELAERLGDPSLRIMDASWHMAAEKRDARQEYEAAHIPGAVFFDIDAASDQASPYPHMLPSPEAFDTYVSALGIRHDDDVVVYDSNGIFSSPRVWWMFRVFGHERIHVLDGGLSKWKAEKRLLESGLTTLKPSHFKGSFRPELLRTRQQIADNIDQPRETVVDARSVGRFSGLEPEPRPHLKSGHIDGSVSLFFKDILSPPFQTMKKPDELRRVFLDRNLDPARPFAATCGSGVTACILALALFELKNPVVPVYDGAWAEWGSV